MSLTHKKTTLKENKTNKNINTKKSLSPHKYRSLRGGVVPKKEHEKDKIPCKAIFNKLYS